MREVMLLTDGVVELRPWTTNDASFLLDACFDAEIRRFWLRQPLETPDDAIAMIEALATSWAEYQKSGAMKRLAFLIADGASAVHVRAELGLDAGVPMRERLRTLHPQTPLGHEVSSHAQSRGG